MADRGHILLGYLPVVAAELREGYGGQDVEDSMSMYALTSSEVVHLEDAIL